MEAMNTTRDRLAEAIAYRRDRFGLVADVFSRETSESTLAHMVGCASDFKEEMGASAEARLGDGLRTLAHDDFSTFATKTRTEYARLFLGPREVVAPLHESAYLSGTSRMFTAETLAVRAFYERYGYRMKAKNREPEDAVGVEFEFLRNLCDRCLAMLAQPVDAPGAAGEVVRLLEAQKLFMREHLGRWAAVFARRVRENDESGFYAVWAGYLLDVLDEDEVLLTDCMRLAALTCASPLSA